ncbi:MAG: tripartite tricarboxylate transporter TctB family protein [Betaproteobacteria bacterium]
MSLRKSVDKSEVVCSAVLIALGAFVVREALAWEYMTRDGPGPGFFPMWIGIAMVALSGLYLSAHLYDIARGESVHRTNWSGTPAVVLAWLAFMVVIALIKPLGFVAALVLMMLIFVRGVFRQSFAKAVVVALASAGAFWMLFVKLLNLRLPAGPWGF